MIRQIDDKIQPIARNLNVAEEARLRAEKVELEEWMSPEDQSAKHTDFLRSRLEGTVQWFLDHAAPWIRREKQHMWYLGHAGIGKTVLTSLLIRHLQTSCPGSHVLYYYFSFKDRSNQTKDKVFSNLLKQLSQRSDVLSPQVKSFHDHWKKTGDWPIVRDLREGLIKALGEADNVYIVVDALDESSSDGTGMGNTSKAITDMLRLLPAKVSWLVTSRDTPAMWDLARDLQTSIGEIQSDEQDITVYLRESIPGMPNLSKVIKVEPGLEDIIIDSVLEHSNHMWVLLQ